MVQRRLLIAAACVAIAGCTNTASHYRPAGFESHAQVEPYLPHYEYFAFHLSEEQWQAFYKRFPEYWRDIQKARLLGYGIEYPPGYVAYAWRWTMLRQQAGWPADLRARLEARQLAPGDDLFMITSALGPPVRVVWNNEHEILVYSPDRALIMDDGKLVREAPCPGCTSLDGVPEIPETTDGDILKALGLRRAG